MMFVALLIMVAFLWWFYWWVPKHRARALADLKKQRRAARSRLTEYDAAVRQLSEADMHADIDISAKECRKLIEVAVAARRIMRGCYANSICPRDLKDAYSLLRATDREELGGVSTATLISLYADAYNTWMDGPYGPPDY